MGYDLCHTAPMSREMPRLTVTLPGDLVNEVRARAGRGGVSAWMAQAAAERLGRDRLAAAIAEYEADAGPITDEEIAAARTRTAWRPDEQRQSPPAA